MKSNDLELLKDLADYAESGKVAEPYQAERLHDLIRRSEQQEEAQFTAVDIADADARGYRSGRESVVVELPKADGPDGDSWDPLWKAGVEACRAAIIAAGGSVKE